MSTAFRSHPTRRMAPIVALLGALVLLLAACGDDDEAVDVGDEPTTTAAAGVVPVDADLTIVAGTIDAPESEGTATLTCDADTGEVSATGWLEGDADEACASLIDPSVAAALDEPPEDQVCTEQYGGPSVATIRGTIGGESVDASLDRRNGCAIERWNQLQLYLPPAAPVE
jgi:hypothetical protein